MSLLTDGDDPGAGAEHAAGVVLLPAHAVHYVLLLLLLAATVGGTHYVHLVVLVSTDALVHVNDVVGVV